MKITCPHCEHALTLKNPKPGRYTPKCSKCGKPFSLTVPEDPNNTFVAEILPARPSPPAKPAAPPRPAQPSSRPAPSVTSPLTGAGSRSAPPSTPSGEETAAELSPSSPASEETGAGLPSEESSDEPTSAAAPSVKSARREGGEPAAELPEALGGYQILKLLGQGGMGSVYLARQLSLDRPVALKTMKAEWAKNPTFMARFTREAYAAAQLVHHNVVQIYDLGRQRDVNYFSMEFVEGKSLGAVVKQDGKLDPEVAVGYILQAARGLKFAHDRGMIHRDIKPDNLMLNTQGVVKVADLGLVKTPGAPEPRPDAPDAAPEADAAANPELTRANTAVGTPAYMAPEQARDSAHVDPRADIYSLGCTLYVLVTGRPPFQGKTIMELLTKHASEPMVPPDVVVRRVPKALSGIVLRMTAKNPDDRYADMDEVIKALEDYLGVQSSGPFTPREEHANLLEECVGRFNGVAVLKRRSVALLGFVVTCSLLVLLSALIRWWLAAGFLGLLVLTPLCHFLITGFAQRTYVFGKVREFVLGSAWTDWLVVAAGALLTLAVVYLLGLLWVALGFGVLAVGLAFAWYYLLDRPVQTAQHPPVSDVEQMLRTMRLRGLDEEALRQFVCKYSGQRWEGFYEALFGYEAKLEARARWGLGEQGRGRPKEGAWREPVVNWLEATQKARREARERRHLQAIEQQRLQAEGVATAEAQARAEQAAAVLVEKASEFKQKVSRAVEIPSGPTRVGSGGLRSEFDVGELLALPDRPTAVPARRRPGALAGLLGLVFGPRTRFLAGAVLIVGCLFWFHQNSTLTGDEIKKLAGEAVGQRDVSLLQRLNLTGTKPLSLPLVPAVITDFFGSWAPGMAGLILVLSAFFRGPRMALFAWPAALVAFAGHRLGLPAVGPVPAEYLGMVAGAGLAVLGLVFGRQRE
jgi:serine/threonine protein kinase